MLEKRPYPLDLIYVPAKRAKTLDQQKVLTLAEDILKNGICLFGSVDTVTDKVVRLYEMGIRHVANLFNFGNMPRDRVENSIRLFAEEVMPRVRERVGIKAAA